VRAVLFDIDGTLVKLGGAGREALARGVAAALGRPFEEVLAAAMEVDFRGRTDTILLEELAGRLGVRVPALDPRMVAAYLGALPETVARSRAEGRYETMPGALELVADLESRTDVLVGLLTGNVREAARIKLAPVGLGHLADRPGGFGDDARERADVARAAVRRLAEAGIPPERVLVVGDTEHDVSAAHAAGARAVAVATGWTDPAVLRACGADLFLPDLRDPAPFLRFLESMGLLP